MLSADRADKSVTEMEKRPLEIVLAQPRGFCAGVVRAVDIVERALELHGPPVYVRHEIVHNRHVVDDLRRKGAVFVEEVSEIPVGSLAVFSAHGVSRKVEADSRERSLQVIDATCPLVTKVHYQARRYENKGFDIILIGHAGHPEVEGTMGQIDGTVHLVSDVSDVNALELPPERKLAYVTQTTLSVDDTREVINALKLRFPAIHGPDVKDICYATQNRQSAVRELAREVDVVIVIGADYSSNSRRLQEIGEESGTLSFLIPDADHLEVDWLEGAESVGITAGASAPEVLVEGLVDKLRENFQPVIRNLGEIKETVSFNLPRELRSSDANPA